MSLSVSLHATLSGLCITQEMPRNSGLVTLSSGDGGEVEIYSNLTHWWLLRQLPKAPNYTYYGDPGVSIQNHAEADAAALAYYKANTQDIDPDASNYSPTVSKEAVKP